MVLSRFSPQRSFFTVCTWALVCFALARSLTTSATSAPDGPGDWLNVQDCGASGSEFETTAATTAGSHQIVVANVGDFRVGQGLMVSKCNIQYPSKRLWGPGEPYVPEGQQPLDDTVKIRGYDGSAGSWMVYILEVDGATPLTFRWSDDLARTWKDSKVPVTYDWQKLNSGIEVRFSKRDWKPGHFITFTARDQLVTTIKQIEGNVLTVEHPANRTAEDAVVRHCDSAALQAVINRAIQERKNVFVPMGHYRLTHGLTVRNADGITIEGASGVHTLLDIADGEGACFSLYRGKEVTLRNFRLRGHTGLAEAAGWFRTSSGFTFWACTLKGCNAATLNGTERVLIENVHASRMASECFISYGPSRAGREEPQEHTRSATFLRCSVTDCAANAFNNCDFAENTSVLYCRIDGMGWHAYEGSGRFVRLIGNYIRNAGPFTVGDIPHNLPRLGHLEDLGVGQAVVANNVFEGIGRCGGIVVNHGPTQVVVANNLFINYNGHAISTLNATVHNSFPAQNIVVTGNIIDMTYGGEDSKSRVGIIVNTSETTVSDNQVYVRGAADPEVTGIQIRESALNVNVHDNLIQNCGHGLLTHRLEGQVTEVVDARTFLQSGIPLERATSHLYRGWHFAWRTSGQPRAVSMVEFYDPVTFQFRLTEPRQMKVGDRFEVFPPAANWKIHHNTVADCLRPVVLDSYGSETSFFTDNTVARGGATGVKQAVEVHGTFRLLSNHLHGFDEPGSAALGLYPDAIGRAGRSLYQGNIVERCAVTVAESQKGLWEASTSSGNLFLDCGRAPQTAAVKLNQKVATVITPTAPKKPVFRAGRPPASLSLDGQVGEWPWPQKARVIALGQTPQGDPLPSPRGFACAASDDRYLYLSLRLPAANGVELRGGTGWGQGDGVEVSFQFRDTQRTSPIFLLWGSVDGQFTSGPYGGATPAQVEGLQKATSYASSQGPEGWSCEWRIPLTAVGMKRAVIQEILFNVGAHHSSDDSWSAWVGTGAELFRVDRAGELVLAK